MKKVKDPNRRKTLKKDIWRNRELYMFLFPALCFLLLFSYVPMYGILMGFQDVKIGNGFAQNDWVGLYHFKRFFSSNWAPTTIINTARVSLISLMTWPIPICLALMLHNSTSKFIKKMTQGFTYLPHLLSTVLIVSILNVFCNGTFGLINLLLHAAGKERIMFFGDPNWVVPLYIISGVWSSAGYSAIVYLGALSAVDEEQMEAAKLDGASKLKCIWHVQLPAILPTVVTMLILTLGSLFAVGTEKMLLLQTNLNMSKSEVIGTYVFKAGMNDAQYGFSTAVGLFQNLINITCMFVANFVSKKVADTSII